MSQHPESQEGERGVLGAILQEPSLLISDCWEVEPEWFFRPDHRHLFTFLRSLSDARKPWDLVELPGIIMSMSDQDQHAFGSITYICDLPGHCPSPSALPSYKRQIRAAFIARQIIKSCEGMIRMATEEWPLGIEDVRESMIGELHRINAIGNTGSDSILAADAITAAANIIDQTQQARLAGVPFNSMISTGYKHLDRQIGGGLTAGNMMLIGGRPGFGKSALALSIATEVARASSEDGQHTDVREAVLLISLELDRIRMANRLAALAAQIDHDRLRLAELDDAEWDRLIAARDRISEFPLYLVDKVNQTARSIAGSIYTKAASHSGGLRLVVVDYLQLMRLEDVRRDRRDLAVGDGLRLIHQACKDVGAALIMVSQLNRAAGKAQPSMSDWAESGIIEQDADILAAIDRPAFRGEDCAKDITNLHILKARDGSVGMLPGRFDGARQEFRIYGTNRDDAGPAPIMPPAPPKW